MMYLHHNEKAAVALIGFVVLVLFVVCAVVLIRLALTVLVNGVSFLWNLIGGPPVGARAGNPALAGGAAVMAGPVPCARICANVRCHAPNPPNARYCRRCGQKL